ncbi:hypothetical protein FKW77_005163 [Venturia effusa]|uniref:Uncharacterized protein n=1 Tax=Venturia effusa TaxID=50376 RepID=A0A517L994_9PEZI|nr:hypothetical protein FKW77_005163 [Venturia effusa]
MQPHHQPTPPRIPQEKITEFTHWTREQDPLIARAHLINHDLDVLAAARGYIRSRQNARVSSGPVLTQGRDGGDAGVIDATEDEEKEKEGEDDEALDYWHHSAVAEMGSGSAFDGEDGSGNGSGNGNRQRGAGAVRTRTDSGVQDATVGTGNVAGAQVVLTTNIAPAPAAELSRSDDGGRANFFFDGIPPFDGEGEDPIDKMSVG